MAEQLHGLADWQATYFQRAIAHLCYVRKEVMEKILQDVCRVTDKADMILDLIRGVGVESVQERRGCGQTRPH